MKYIEEPKENEQARMEACFALSWVATDDQMKSVVKKVHDVTGTDPKSNLLRQCYLETLVHRPVPDATAGLIDLLVPAVPDIEVRHQVARAIGMGGITRDMVPQLFDEAERRRPQVRRRAGAHPRRRRGHGVARAGDLQRSEPFPPRRSRS